MNALDLVLLALIGFGIIKGFLRGFMVTLASTIGVIVAVVLSIKIGGTVTAHYSIKGFESFLIYAVLFLGIYSIMLFIANLIRNLLKVLLLGWIDRLLGALLGALELGIVALLLCYGLSRFEAGQSVIAGSKLAPLLLNIVNRFAAN